MKPFTFILSCILSLNGICQNWSFFTQDPAGMFQVTSSLFLENPSLHFKPGDAVPYAIDSTVTVDSTTMVYGDRIIGCSVNDKESACYFRDSNCSDYFAWIGDPLIRTNNRTIAITRWNDSVVLPNRSLVIDTIWAKADTVIVSQLSSVQQSFVFGELDSVATFTLSALVGGVPHSSSPWHGMEVQTSLNHGVIKTPSWYLFPRFRVDLVRMTEGSQITLKNKSDIQGFEVGDKIEMRRLVQAGYTQYGGYANDEQYDVYRIIGSIVEISLDSYLIDAQQELKRHHYVQDPYGSGTTLDSVSIVVSNVQVSIPRYRPSVESLGFLYFGDFDEEAFTYAVDELNSTYPISNGSAGCPFSESSPVFERSYGHETKFRLGVGLVFEQEAHAYFGTGNVSWNATTYEVTYFKSDSIEFGTKGWPIGTEDLNVASQLSVFPNPASEYIELRAEQTMSQVELISTTGKHRLRDSILDSKTHRLDVSNCAPGVYFLRLTFSNGLHDLRTIVIQ